MFLDVCVRVHVNTYSHKYPYPPSGSSMMLNEAEIYKTTHNIYLLLAEPRLIRFPALPPGEDFNFDSRFNRFGVVVVVVSSSSL